MNNFSFEVTYFYIQNPHYLRYFSLLLNAVYWWLSSVINKDVRKGNDVKNQLNEAHAQLLEKLRPIAFAETCRFLTIQSLEFQDIWQNIVQKPRE